jgi:hypothetical protein
MMGIAAGSIGPCREKMPFLRNEGIYSEVYAGHFPGIAGQHARKQRIFSALCVFGYQPMLRKFPTFSSRKMQLIHVSYMTASPSGKPQVAIFIDLPGSQLAGGLQEAGSSG